MQKLVSALEQEMKFVSDSEEGHPQYRKGYVRALELVVLFLTAQAGHASFEMRNYPAVDRLLLTCFSLECEEVFSNIRPAK